MPKDVSSLLSRINQADLPYRVFENTRPVQVAASEAETRTVVEISTQPMERAAAPRGIVRTAVEEAAEGVRRRNLLRRYSAAGRERSDRLQELFARYAEDED